MCRILIYNIQWQLFGYIKEEKKKRTKKKQQSPYWLHTGSIMVFVWCKNASKNKSCANQREREIDKGKQNSN